MSDRSPSTLESALRRTAQRAALAADVPGVDLVGDVRTLLDHVAELADVRTTGVEPTYGLAETPAVMRMETEPLGPAPDPAPLRAQLVVRSGDALLVPAPVAGRRETSPAGSAAGPRSDGGTSS